MTRGLTLLSLLSLAALGRAHADDELFTVPNLMYLPFEQAEATLKRAGFRGTLNRDDNSLCGSVVEGRIVEKGQICSQQPAAGSRQAARLSLTVRTQTEDPRHGNLGKPNEWHLMPNLIGMKLDAAMAAMREAGFTDTDQIQVRPPSEGNCEAGRVCRAYPDAFERIGQHSTKTIFINPEKP